MDDLLQKYNDFMRLNNCRAEYLLSNGQTIDFVYKEENFIHLLGLHKLIDIQLIQLFNDKTNKMVQTKYIISRIKKEKSVNLFICINSSFIIYINQLCCCFAGFKLIQYSD